MEVELYIYLYFFFVFRSTENGSTSHLLFTFRNERHFLCVKLKYKLLCKLNISMNRKLMKFRSISFVVERMCALFSFILCVFVCVSFLFNSICWPFTLRAYLHLTDRERLSRFQLQCHSWFVFFSFHG